MSQLSDSLEMALAVIVREDRVADGLASTPRGDWRVRQLAGLFAHPDAGERCDEDGRPANCRSFWPNYDCFPARPARDNPGKATEELAGR